MKNMESHSDKKNKIFIDAIKSYKKNGSVSLPDKALDEGSDFCEWLQNRPADIFFLIDKCALPILEGESLEDYYDPEDYDGKSKILELMQDSAKSMALDSTSLHAWPEGNFYISFCLDLEGYEPILHSFDIHDSQITCFNEYKEWYVVLEDESIVSHSDTELLNIFQNRRDSTNNI